MSTELIPPRYNKAQIEYRASLWRAVNKFSINMLEATEKYKKGISRKRKSQPSSITEDHADSMSHPARKKQRTVPHAPKPKHLSKNKNNDDAEYKCPKPKCPYKRILCEWTSPVKQKPKNSVEEQDKDGDISMEVKDDKVEINKTAEKEIHSKMKNIVYKLSTDNKIKLSPVVDNALKIWKICCEKNLIGRYDAQFLPSILLYIACRQLKPDPLPYLINDFAKLCRINPQKLASKVHKLCKDIAIKMNTRPDSTMFVTRFANMLRFGDETDAIVDFAMKLIAQMKEGVHPAGIYAAAIVIASRIHVHGFYKRSVKEVAALVNISEDTIKKRVEELKNTKIALMTVKEFLNMK